MVLFVKMMSNVLFKPFDLGIVLISKISCQIRIEGFEYFWYKIVSLIMIKIDNISSI